MAIVLAHRGASRAARENTLDAFRAARALGADGVELDVRRSADGTLVVHHDPLLPDGRPVAGLPMAEMPPWVPALDAALEECEGMVVDVEIKNLPSEVGFDPEEAAAREVVALLVRRAGRDQVVVASFSLATLEAVRAAESSVPTAWVTPGAFDQHQALALAADRGCAALQPRHEAVTVELVEAAHDRGMTVYAWTVDDAERVRWLAGTGVDGVITNVPDVALDALGRPVLRRARPGPGSRAGG